MHIPEATQLPRRFLYEGQPSMYNLEIEVWELARGAVEVVDPVVEHFRRAHREGLVNSDRPQAEIPGFGKHREGNVRVAHQPAADFLAQPAIWIEFQPDHIA